MKYHSYDKFENMMLNIVQEGKQKVWQSIEKIKNPFERCKQRKLFAEALKKIERSENE